MGNEKLDELIGALSKVNPAEFKWKSDPKKMEVVAQETGEVADSIDITSGMNMSGILSGYQINTQPSYGNITISTTAGSNGSSGSYLYSNGASPSWNTISPLTTTSPRPGITVSGDAEFEGKVKINGQDLGEFMETISKRLAILVPDPDKLEHFEALKKAYNHYKTLEALCELPTKETKE